MVWIWIDHVFVESWSIMVNHGQSWSIMVNHGQSWSIQSWSKTWSKIESDVDGAPCGGEQNQEDESLFNTTFNTAQLGFNRRLWHGMAWLYSPQCCLALFDAFDSTAWHSFIQHLLWHGMTQCAWLYSTPSTHIMAWLVSSWCLWHSTAWLYSTPSTWNG